MKITEDLTSKVFGIVTSKDFNSKTKGTVRFIINQCYAEISTCLQVGLPIKDLVRILNEKTKDNYIFRYDSFFKAWKKINQPITTETTINHSTNSVIEKTFKPTATNVNKDVFIITGDDKLGNIFTNDPTAPFGRDRYCFPYHEVKEDKLEQLLKNGHDKTDAILILKYDIEPTELFGSNLPLKSKITPIINNRIDSIRKKFSLKNIGIIKSKYKEIIK